MAQKARREAKEKAKEEAERQRVAEEEERKRRTVEYLQRLQNKVIVENAVLLEGAEGSQVMGSKCKETPPEDNADYWPSKKAKRKQPARYRGDVRIKLEGLILVKDVCTIQGK